MLRCCFRAWAATSPLPDVQLQLVPVGKLRDELLVSFGFDSAQLVIEVDDGEHDTEFRPQLQHDAQQCDRIGPA